MQLSAHRPTNPQLSAWTPAVESVGQAESGTVEALIKRSFIPFLCIYLLVFALNVLCINYISVVYMMRENI